MDSYSNKPYADACALYEEGEAAIFKIMSTCINNGGVVYSDHSILFCVYPALIENKNNNSEKTFDKSNAWHVCILSGDVLKMFDKLPRSDYLTWHRMDKKLRVIKWEEAIRRYNNVRYNG